MKNGKKFISFIVNIVIITLLCSQTNIALAAYYDEGNDGNSWETAYIIDSVEDWLDLSTRNNGTSIEEGKYYKLGVNINIDLDNPIVGYSGYVEGLTLENGNFDGQNHTINFKSYSNDVMAGLFEHVNGSQSIIKNLNAIGDIRGDCVGTIVHYLNEGKIENCTFNGTITCNNEYSSYGAGGIVAHMHGGTVTNCRVSADISAAAYAGGIAGEMSGGIIENCIVTSNTKITGKSVGGIVGEGFGSEIILSGNEWPSQYPQVGSGEFQEQPTSSDSPLITWNAHRYQLFNQNLTWEEAKSRCEALGGHLLTITSQAEQNVIETMLRDVSTNFDSYWIGAKISSEGFIEWVTDEVFEKQFKNFDEAQPDGVGNYVQIYVNEPLGKWDDTTNDETERGFICEWEEEQEEIKAAPLSPNFEKWLANPDEGREPENGTKPSPEDLSHLSNNPPKLDTSNITNIPTSYDSRLTTGLPEVRAQGNFNTCWAFAAIGAMEADYMAQKITTEGNVPDLSELQVAWFTFKDPSSDNFMSNKAQEVLLKGGDSNIAVSFLSKMSVTPINESEMPYTVAGEDKNNSNSKIEAFLNGRKSGDFKSSHVSLKESKKFGDYVNDSNMNDIKKAIMEHGAVYFSFYQIPDGYKNDAYYYTGSNNSSWTHAVLLVGWDDNYSVENFKEKPSKNGAWLVRNSMGKSVGNDGYFWLSYEQASTATGMGDPTTFIVRQNDEEDENIHVQEHDENGKTKNISSTWSSNIFHSERNESLVRIGFYVNDNNAEYKIFVNNFGKIKPTDPGRAEIPLLSGEIPNAGYYTVDLPEAINFYEGDYYAIIIQFKLSSDYQYPTGVEASINKYVTAKVNQGESFFADGDPVPSLWQDGVNIEGGPYNACIKAFTLPRLSNETAPSITTDFLPDATVGMSYNFTLTASGTSPIEWRSGTIPAGLALSKEGILSGQPEKSGNYDIDFVALNNVGKSNKTLTFTIKDNESNNIPNNNTPNNNTNRSGVSRGGSGNCNFGLNNLCGVILLALFINKKFMRN